MISLTRRIVDLCWLAFLVYWAANALLVKRTVKSESRRWTLAVVIAALAAVVLVKLFPGVRDFMNLPIWPIDWDFGLPAVACALAGIVTLIWARNVIGRNWSGGVVLKEDHELVTAGPYAYVRHPIYSGLFLLMSGMVLSYDNRGMLALFAVVVVGLWYKSTVEERFMTRHFPEKYPAYMKKTKALIPFIF